jgi:alanine dehydrogenase
MKIGVPKEIKDQEYRVGLTPAAVQALCQYGHEVHVEKDAGSAIGYRDSDYQRAGAIIVDYPEQVYESPMVVKVKEPQPDEFDLLSQGQVLFTYLHLAPDPKLTSALLRRGVIGIAYETVSDKDGRLPLLIPMSEVAGRLSIQAGSTCLQKHHGGNGMLLGGVPGVAAARVVIIGGGVVGTQAARMAMGLGAEVTILDKNLDRLRQLDDLYGPLLRTRYADQAALEQLTHDADLVIGAVLLPGKQAPKLISRDMINNMKSGSVVVDVAIDQGGCAETSRPTTHSEPTYIVDDVVHYCVANMPGASARTSTQALTNATMPYVLELANKGYARAMLDNPGLANGLNVYQGKVTYQAVAEALGYEYHPAEEVLRTSLDDDAISLAS